MEKNNSMTGINEERILDEELKIMDREMSEGLIPSHVDEDGNVMFEWDMISAFDSVIEAARLCRGCIDHDQKALSAMAFLRHRLQMTQMQIFIIGMLIEEGTPMSWHDIAHFLDVSRLRAMTYTDEIDELMTSRPWITSAAVRNRNGKFEGFALVPGVIRAIRHNEIYVPESIDGLDEQAFIDRIVSRFSEVIHDDESCCQAEERWLLNLVDHNPELPLCQTVRNLEGDNHCKCFLLFVVYDYIMYGGQPNEGLRMRDIDAFFPEDWQCNHLRRRLSSGTHELFAKGFVEHKCTDGLVDSTMYVLTQKAKDTLLTSVSPNKPSNKPTRDRDLLSYKNIEPKELYYNDQEQKIVDRLRTMLTKENFPLIQERLKKQGMRTGVCILLNGGPGTGKTELVKQLSRETKRNLLMIDISQVKDKWVGESEKNCKAIFERYERLCNNADTPILFINECDSILGKRMENVTQGSEKMLNSMQNILLQAMEDFKGIMICTTNMAEKGLDNAFMRRFLVKAEFNKPDASVRSRIWKSIMPDLSINDAHYLAEHYNFSGGQCENVSRKATIEHVISGEEITLATLCELCNEENLFDSNSTRRAIGFAC